MRNVAVVALTKNLADELGPHGINVTVVHPGTTRTERTEGVVAARADVGGARAVAARASARDGTARALSRPRIDRKSVV